MSVLKHASAITSHHVHTSIAHLLERQFRFHKWAMELLMGNGNVPCDPFSCPEADGVLELAFDSSTGLITIDSYDLSCVDVSRACREHDECHNCNPGHHLHGPCHEHKCNHNHGHFNYVHRAQGHLPHGHFDAGHNNHVAHIHGNHHHDCHGKRAFDHSYCGPTPHHNHHRFGWHNHNGNHAWHDYHRRGGDADGSLGLFRFGGGGCGSCGGGGCNSCSFGRDRDCGCDSDSDSDCGSCRGGGEHHRRHRVGSCGCSPSSGKLVKRITIDCPPEVRNRRKIIYLCNTTVEDPDDPTTFLPVEVHLTNNGCPVVGQKVYLVAPGQLRYLLIEYGRITTIMN